MASQIKGPAIFLAQFIGDKAPFDSLENITRWAAGLGYKGVQIPTIDKRVFDLELAVCSDTYIDEVKGICKNAGVEITELSVHLQGQLLAVSPAYNESFDVFAPEEFRGNPSLAFPFLYPWPQRPEGLIEEAFDELGRRWLPILQHYSDHGQDLGFEIHPGEDVFDGATWEMFLDSVGEHAAAKINYDPSHFLLQQLDYLAFIDLYHERINAFHVKDAEFNPDGRQGVYSGYQNWMSRAGRFRSLGDGQVDFAGIFSKLTQYGYDSWAVLEWECCIKSPEQGATEGAKIIQDLIINCTDKKFDDFAGGKTNDEDLKNILNI